MIELRNINFRYAGGTDAGGLVNIDLTRINRKSLFYIFPLCVTLKKKGVFHYVTYG